MAVLARAYGSSTAVLLSSPSILRTAFTTCSATSSLFSAASTQYRRSLRILPVRTRRPASLRIRAARTESTGVSLGFRAPYFELPEPLTGKTVKLDDFEGNPALLDLAVVAISSNSTITHPQDGPEFMAEDAKSFGYPFPYLFDESQEVARAFGAVCTPEFFLFKKDGRRPFELVYHGQFDDSRPSNSLPVTGRDLSQAIDCVLSGQKLLMEQKPSVGCSIKWHPS